ncbi:hypothetical protein ACIPSA_35545 [Streptomyces sp. NPDC086549]|uniref:hypothetical protein n=1 Tax=Streptomyces sp. NPDC086549 TaxID=3365752 RepID=UPI0037FEC74B
MPLDGVAETAGAIRETVGRAQRDHAVATALKELRRADGYRRGIAAQLAREHGGNERTWQRARTEARALYQRGQGQDDTSPAALAAKPSP